MAVKKEKPLVFLETQNKEVAKMFRNEGWGVTSNGWQADLICFTPGPDISPMLYGHSKNPKTKNDYKRDEKARDLFIEFEFALPLVGIGRGAQFLNVMNNGTLFQDVDNHDLEGTHEVKDFFGNKYEVTSRHHQMMMISSNVNHQVILTSNRSTKREMECPEQKLTQKEEAQKEVESVWFSDNNSLCFQPNPEKDKGSGECKDLFFTLLALFPKVGAK